MSDLSTYIDDDGKQVRPLPKSWLVPPKRAKPGTKVVYLLSRKVYVGPARTGIMSTFDPQELDKEENWKDLLGQIGTITKVTPGRSGTGRYIPSYDCYDNDSEGWLTVQFPFSPYRNSKGEFDPMALHLGERPTKWKFVD